MGRAIAVRTDYRSGDVRRVAQRVKNAAQARRLLAIAAALECQRPQHLPWRVAPAECHNEAPALSNGLPSFSRNDMGRLAGDAIGVSKYFALQESTSDRLGLP
jgi:hypothetical protein